MCAYSVSSAASLSRLNTLRRIDELTDEWPVVLIRDLNSYSNVDFVTYNLCCCWVYKNRQCVKCNSLSKLFVFRFLFHCSHIITMTKQHSVSKLVYRLAWRTTLLGCWQRTPETYNNFKLCKSFFWVFSFIFFPFTIRLCLCSFFPPDI